MQITRLDIQRKYTSGKGWALAGEIRFEEEGFGTIGLVLDEKAIHQIIFACADTLERVSRESADNLRAAILGSISEVKQVTG